jgi:hypothetical protein
VDAVTLVSIIWHTQGLLEYQLLVSQRLDGIEVRSLAGWVVAEKDADCGCKNEASGDNSHR